MKKVSIYQIFTRLFGNKNTQVIVNGSRDENGLGKLNDFSDKALSEIKELGITHIWYTGVIEHARCDGYADFGFSDGNQRIIKGKAGSPYAITDYYDINPDLAQNIPERMKEFEDLVTRTHTAGLKVIIDFVPNHVARFYESKVFPEKNFGLNDDNTKAFSVNNDYYYLPNELLVLPKESGTKIQNKKTIEYVENPAKVTGNDCFSAYVGIDDWYETVKLNYGIDYLNNHSKLFEPLPPLWNKMVDILLFWAEKSIDGFRCDMVEMVPVEFWEYAIPKVKKSYPNIIFIGEVYKPTLYDKYLCVGGFDFLYDKVGLYDSLKDIIQNKKSTSEITKCWQALNGKSHKMLSFLENHDEQRVASEFFADEPFKAIPAFIVCATINNGAVMTYFGQEVGEAAKGEIGYSGDDGRTSIFDYCNVPEHQKWMNNGKFDGGALSENQKALRNKYKDILNLSLKYEAISKGEFHDLMWINAFDGAKRPDKIYAYLRYTKKEKLLFILNFDAEISQQSVLKIPDEIIANMGFSKGKKLVFEGVLFETKKITTSVEEIQLRGYWFNIPPMSGKVFQISEI